MNKKYLIVVWGILMLLFTVPLMAAGQLDEVNAKFTYKGKPIHPSLVEEFSSWISDPGEPTAISVDVAAKHGNEYFEDNVKIEQDGSVVLQKDNGDTFYYKWLGKLNNGIHVLYVGEGGSGSGVFGSLFFVQFDMGEGINREGKKYERLLMTIVRNYILGDRDNGEIKVLKDKVILGKSQYRDKPVVLEFATTSPLFAQNKHSIDKLEEECINKDSTTVGMNNCAMKACKQWDVELNKYYKLLMGILSKEEKQQLKDAQVAWLKYRDLETKFRMDTFLNNQGTMYSNMAMREKLDIVKQRALELKSLYDTLKVARE